MVAAGRTGERTAGDGQVTDNGRSLVVRPDARACALDRRPRDLLADRDPEVLAGDRQSAGIFREKSEPDGSR